MHRRGPGYRGASLTTGLPAHTRRHTELRAGHKAPGTVASLARNEIKNRKKITDFKGASSPEKIIFS